MALLEVKNLMTEFYTEEGLVRAVDSLSFELDKKERMGIIGESGCGKSVTALSIMRLIPSPPGKISSGEIWFDSKNLLLASEEEMRKIRGQRIAMIFQEPLSSLNPVFTIGDQIAEVLRVHKKLSRKEALEKAVEALRVVGIPDPKQRAREYPHQLSGGMCQRAMIAMALVCGPELLIADEPTTALDVTIQAQILELINKLVDDFSMSLLLITHDLGVIAETVEKVLVMYTGVAVEKAEVKELFSNPLHPYTKGLFASMPGLKKEGGYRRKERLYNIPGVVPSLVNLPPGCPFQDRCSIVKPHCREAMPELEEKIKGHFVRCFEVN